MLLSLRHPLAILLLLVPILCGAAEKTYAVLSLIGDRLMLVDQPKALDEGGGAELMLPVLKEMLAKVGATHLLLVSKHRGEARLLFADGRMGNGFLEGLGFYIDRNNRVENVQTGDTSFGYLAPFAYFRVALIDLAASRVLGEEVVTASRAIGAQDKSNPWDVLSGDQKVTLLQDFIRAETRRAVTALVKEK